MTETATTRCPRCRNDIDVLSEACEHCGFPMSCDISPLDEVLPITESLMPVWRVLAGFLVIIFVLTNGVLINTGYNEYHGQSVNVLKDLDSTWESSIPVVASTKDAEGRIRRALHLLELRAPDFYWRMTDHVAKIEYMPQTSMEYGAKEIPLHNIAAMAQPATGNVFVLHDLVYPNGMANYYDYDVYQLACTLVHELRHLELHDTGTAPGGWEEELLCEYAAHAAAVRMQAPGVILSQFELYVRDPQAKRYQGWYDWYKHFD